MRAVFIASVAACMIAFAGCTDSASASRQNPLEKATLVGQSTRADYDSFVDKGGLEGTNVWRDFRVNRVQMVFDKSDKVGLVILQIEKSWPGRTLASMENLRNALADTCGKSWQRNAVGNGASAKTSEGLTCMVLDAQNRTVEVTLAQEERR